MFLPIIDLEIISNTEKIIQKIVKLYNFCIVNNISIGTYKETTKTLAYIKNIYKEKLYIYNKFFDTFYILSMQTYEEQYSFIYDAVCDYLDNEFVKNNYCNFKNDSCICQRCEKNLRYKKDGCCHTFYYRKFDSMPVWTGKCKYLKQDGGCIIKFITCKMFTCKTLKKQKVTFNYSNIFLLNVFFNKKQKEYLSSAFFTPKEKVIENLINLL